MHNQARHKLLTRFEADQFSEEHLVLLSIPMNLPYPVGSGEFDRVDGEFEYQNETYMLLQQKFENDTLFIVCVKDVEATQISNKLTEYVNLTHDHSGSKQALTFLSKLYKDFNTATELIQVPSRNVIANAFRELSSPALLSRPLQVESPPPDQYC